MSAPLTQSKKLSLAASLIHERITQMSVTRNGSTVIKRRLVERELACKVQSLHQVLAHVLTPSEAQKQRARSRSLPKLSQSQKTSSNW